MDINFNVTRMILNIYKHVVSLNESFKIANNILTENDIITLKKFASIVISDKMKSYGK